MIDSKFLSFVYVNSVRTSPFNFRNKFESEKLQTMNNRITDILIVLVGFWNIKSKWKANSKKTRFYSIIGLWPRTPGIDRTLGCRSNEMSTWRRMSLKSAVFRIAKYWVWCRRCGSSKQLLSDFKRPSLVKYCHINRELLELPWTKAVLQLACQPSTGRSITRQSPKPSNATMLSQTKAMKRTKRTKFRAIWMSRNSS